MQFSEKERSGEVRVRKVYSDDTVDGLMLSTDDTIFKGGKRDRV